MKIHYNQIESKNVIEFLVVEENSKNPTLTLKLDLRAEVDSNLAELLIEKLLVSNDVEMFFFSEIFSNLPCQFSRRSEHFLTIEKRHIPLLTQLFNHSNEGLNYFSIFYGIIKDIIEDSYILDEIIQQDDSYSDQLRSYKEPSYMSFIYYVRDSKIFSLAYEDKFYTGNKSLFFESGYLEYLLKSFLRYAEVSTTFQEFLANPEVSALDQAKVSSINKTVKNLSRMNQAISLPEVLDMDKFKLILVSDLASVFKEAVGHYGHHLVSNNKPIITVIEFNKKLINSDINTLLALYEAKNKLFDAVYGAKNSSVSCYLAYLFVNYSLKDAEDLIETYSNFHEPMFFHSIANFIEIIPYFSSDKKVPLELWININIDERFLSRKVTA